MPLFTDPWLPYRYIHKMYEIKPIRKLTPEEIKIITILAEVTPKPNQGGRRMALPCDPTESE